MSNERIGLVIRDVRSDVSRLKSALEHFSILSGVDSSSTEDIQCSRAFGVVAKGGGVGRITISQRDEERAYRRQMLACKAEARRLRRKSRGARPGFVMAAIACG